MPPKNQVKKTAAPKVEVPPGVDQDQEQQDTVQAEAQAQVRKRHPGPWKKLSKQEILDHSHAGNLIGHDPATDEVILKDPDFQAPSAPTEPSGIIR